MASSLVPVAEISNGLVVVITLSCFIAMVAFLFRVRGGLYETSVKYIQNLKNPKTMICVQNPIVLQLCSSSEHSLLDVPLKISIQVKCLLRAFWGVTIDSSFLSLPWSVLRNSLLGEEDLHFSYMSQSILHHVDICQDFVMHLSPLENISAQSLGDVPRTKYPLLVILTRECDLSESEDHNTVVGSISIIHIKDSICKMESNILAQYIKQANGQTCNFKQLYMPSTSSDNVCNSSSDGYEVCDSCCVVCQALPASRVLLPCRHACICHRCFSRLDKCPICRSIIQSYFCIQNEDYSPVEETTETHQPRTWGERWERFNDRLNEWLGFV